MNTIEIRWHGRGGQGVVTANEILAGAALWEGKHIKAFPQFGPERMGAPIMAFTRISDEPVKVHSQVYEPDIVIVLDATLIDNPLVTSGLKEDTIVLVNYNGSASDLAKGLGVTNKVYAVDATQIAVDEIGRPVANTAMLGALVKVRGLVALESVLDEAKRNLGVKLPQKVVDRNIKAIRRAFEEVE